MKINLTKLLTFVSILFLVALYGNVVIYIITYFIPLMTKLLQKSDKSLIYMFEFGLIPRTHYYNIVLIYSYLLSITCTNEIVLGDSLFLIFLEHASAMFEIIG